MIKISKSTILIVDDDDLICETLQDIFQEKGYNVSIAKNGQQGIIEAEQAAFDVALIDIILPDMNGIDLLREFKKIYPEKIYIIITANATLQNAISALKDGADDYFIKPLVIDEILRKAQDELEKKRFQQELLELVDEIDELKKVEQKLKESEEEFRMLFEYANDGIFLHEVYDNNTPGKFIKVNEKACQIYGYNREELLELTPYDLVEPTHLSETSKVPKTLREKGDLTFETEDLKKNGEKIYIEASSHIFRLNGKNMALTIVRDITERKKSEQKLRDSEEKYKDLSKEMEMILDHLPSIVVYKDTKNNLIRVNKFTADAQNMTKEEMMGRSCFDLYPKEEAQAYWDDDLEVINSRKPKLNIVEPWKTEEGTRWVITSKIPQFDRDGNVKGIIALATDITERKFSEDKLKESEEKFRALFENTNDSIFIHDRGSQFIEVNQTACERLGYTREELLKLAPKDITPPGYKIDLQANTKNLHEKGELMIESEHITKDGIIVPVEISSRIFNFGGKSTIISVVRDITERKVVEQELKKSEHNLKERVKELTCLYGLSRLFENPGISLNEIFQGTLDLIPPSWQFPEITCARIIFNEKDYMTSNFNESKWKLTSKTQLNGKLIEIEVLYLEENPFLKEEASLLDEIVNRLKSIIEYKIIEEELIRKEKLAAIGTLIGSIGHELRNPLGVINNSVYFLNQRIKDKDEKVSKHLNILQIEIDKANKFISDLLDFIRLRTPTFKEGNINKAIENVVDEILIPENIILDRNLEVNLPTVHFDLIQMKQVFYNLIFNAIQAMPEGGKLEIKTLRREDFVEIIIKDSGIGISEENIDKIFDPLFTTKTIGIGLGLTIVKDIVDKHRGIVEVISNIGKGTIFKLKMPLRGREL